MWLEAVLVSPPQLVLVSLGIHINWLQANSHVALCSEISLRRCLSMKAAQHFLKLHDLRHCHDPCPLQRRDLSAGVSIDYPVFKQKPKRLRLVALPDLLLSTCGPRYTVGDKRALNGDKKLSKASYAKSKRIHATRTTALK